MEELSEYEEQPRRVNVAEQEGHPCWGLLVLTRTIPINEDADQLHTFRVIEKYWVRREITLKYFIFS